jgi:alkylation response protein AidB-like acyl-CoA dehydrogenase
MIAQLDNLLDSIAEQADEIDRIRELPQSLVGELKSAGLFRALIPARFKGLELAFEDYVKIVQRIAEADASTAWCVNQGAVIATTSLWFNEELIHEIWETPETSVANGPPYGCSVTAQSDGYVLNGHWGFSSGCQHATWMNGAARLADGSGWRLAYFKPADVEFIDNWQVPGLRGTGSFEFKINDLQLPASRVADVGAAATVDMDITNIPTALLFAISFAAVALGLARGALNDCLQIAEDKHPRYAPSGLKDDPNTHRFIGKAEARWRANDAYLHATIRDVFGQVRRDGSASVDSRASLRMCGTHVIRECAEVLDLAYKVVGATGIYQEQNIQRRFQDMHVMTQHVQARESHFNLVGNYLISKDYSFGPMS